MAEFFSLRDTFHVLDDLGYNPRIRKYMEIGVHKGASLKAVLEAFPYMEKVVVADNWEYWEGEFGTKEGSREYIEGVIESTGFSLDKVTFLEGNSQKLVPGYLETEHVFFDLVFVDGNHGKEPTRRDVLNVYEHTDIVVLHDTFLHPHLLDLTVQMYRARMKTDWWLIFAREDPHGTAMFVRKRRPR